MPDKTQDQTKAIDTQARTIALAEFYAASNGALFNQIIIAYVRDCSTATMERDRWVGGGIPFIKIGRACKYRKADVLVWLEQYQPQNSTSEGMTVGANRDDGMKRLSPCETSLIKVRGGTICATRPATGYQTIRLYFASAATRIKVRIIRMLVWLSITGSSIC